MILLQDAKIAPTPDLFRAAESGLLEQTGGQMAFWSGRAATGLHLAYRVALQRRPSIQQPEVILPAMMCVTAANTALLSGLAPRFADVDPDSGLMSLETVQACFTERTVAVVVIHLLGHMVDIEPIAAWCRQNDLLLIEDPTQALGGLYPDGRFTGSTGEMMICSMNRTKIIGRGNGVLIANSVQSAEQLQTILQEDSWNMPDLPEDIHLQLALSYRNLHHSLVGLLRLRSIPVQRISDSFMTIRSAYENLYLRAANPTVDLDKAWKELPASLERRLHLARIYAENLQGGPWKLLTDYESSRVCWRFSLLLDAPDQQVAFSETVRQDGFHVSNLYWPANQFFKPDDPCSGADTFARRIVNLWVDDSVDEAYVQACSASLLRHAPI